MRVQKALLDSFGIERLHAVMGPSMGGLQTFEWAATYPDCVGRIIPVIAAPNFGGWLTAWLSLWAQPIKLDPAWNGGDYYGDASPRAGLEAALQIITLHALHSHWADEAGGRALAPGRTPATSPLELPSPSSRRSPAATQLRAAKRRRQSSALSRARQPVLCSRRAGAGATSSSTKALRGSRRRR